MTLSIDNILQSNTGDFEGTSGSVTLPVGTQAGSVIIIVAGLGGNGADTSSFNTPSGFEGALNHAAQSLALGTVWAYIKTNASADETSWTLSINLGGSQQVVWSVFEITGIVNGSAYLKSVPTPSGLGTLVSSRTTPSSSGSSESYDTLFFAGFFANSSDTTVPVLTAPDGWSDIANDNRVNATRAHTLMVAARPSISLETIATLSCTATVSPNSYVHAGMFVLNAIGATYAMKIDAMFGAEIGTPTNLSVTGIANGDGPAPWDAVVGSPAIITTSPRSGSYCMELSSVASIECVTWNDLTPPANGTLNNLNPLVSWWIERFHVYFPTILPVADTELASVECGSTSNSMTIWYRSSSQKIGVKVGTGTEVLSDAVVTTNQWIGIDYKYISETTTHTVDWQIDYNANTDDVTGPVAQTQASNTGMTAAMPSVVRKGWQSARTATVRYDDIAASRSLPNYPIGDIRILPLKVDPAGTPTVSGTEANFKVFTNNGSMATWTAAGTRNALDDVPPTIGGSSDGLAQVVTASSDYVEIPIETYTSAPDFCIRALRWYFAGWAASGNPATLGIKTWDGVVEHNTVLNVDHGFDDSALVWITRIQGRTSSGFYLLSQTKLDAMAIRVGFCDDANPDVGIHSIIGELAIQPAVVYGIIEAEGGAFNVYVRQDPVSAAVASYLVTTPAGSRGATANFTINGSDSSQYVGPNTTYEKLVGASGVEQVTAVGLTVDPVT